MPYVRPHFHSVFFGEKDLRDFEVHVSGDGSFNAPERDYEIVEVPGKSGDLFFDKGRFKNVDVTYHGFIANDLERNLKGLRSYLLSQNGYKRLEDTYHPDEFRLAVFKGPIDPEIIRLKGGEFDLTFTCKPQRFLKLGEETTRYPYSESSYKVHNQTYNIASPLIRVYGVGTFTISSPTKVYTVTVATHSGISYIDIDCDLGDCFYNATNCNGYVTLSNNEFPKLVPGDNTVVVNSGVTRIEITPRWWDL